MHRTKWDAACRALANGSREKQKSKYNHEKRGNKENKGMVIWGAKIQEITTLDFVMVPYTAFRGGGSVVQGMGLKNVEKRNRKKKRKRKGRVGRWWRRGEK